MKKLNKLFAILIAVLGVDSLSAQTDVTNTYLINAGFDDNSSWITANVAQATSKATKGWTATSSGDTWWYGGAINYGSSLIVNDVTPPAKNPDGKAEGGALGISAGWGCTITYKQEVTLPAGVYTLNYKAYNVNSSATQANNYIGFTSPTVTAYGKTTSFATNTWVEESVTFALPSQTTGSISVGMGAISGGSGANAKLFVDGVTLAYKSFSDVTEASPVDLTDMAVGNWLNANGGVAGTTGTDACGGLTGVSEAYQWGNCLAVADNILTKSLNNLPSGIYTLEIYCASSTTSNRDNTNYKVTDGDKQYVTLTANGESIAIPTYNRTSVSSVPVLTFNNLKITNGNLKLAINIKKASPNWLMAKVKSIKYLGPDKTLSENAFNENYATISNLDTNVPISAEFATEIQTLKNDFASISATSLTQSQLDEANGRMQNVINEYDANIDAYVKLKTYIDMTKVFDEVGTTPYEDKYDKRQFTLNEVESVRQELNVMRFNAASLIFTNKVDVTGWTGTMGERDDQHWSGNTVSYKDANSWGDIDPDALTTQITLPKGNYVLKVAGRAHANAALTLKVLGQTITFHGKGDTGYGIDTNGNANFSPNGTYANYGAGRGWEWEFLKFSLDGEQTVTLEVNSGYNNNWQVWTSFGDITLWMDDATYVTVHGDAIYEPLATAKALVDTKPMGATANNALKNAIAQAEVTISTPAELDGAIEALNDAISTAYAWLPLYNEAKVSLVEALERFEADFNNDEGNEPGYMKKGLWDTVIKEVQEAALAKDVTDSYDGFASAALELNAALDAVRASIDMYANLKAEISYANNYAPMIAENIAGHTDAIATAQALYDAAEADDVSAEILAMQNYRILDHNHVADYIAENNFEIKELVWSGQTNTNNNEHWSGVTNAYFDYSKWSEGYIDGANEAIVTITLSPGEYVLQAAGRVATVAGSEAYIKVNDTKVNFTAKGAYGYGIATDGTATFAKDATYARKNEGFGWEYRSIIFSLAEETEVTLVAGMTIDVNTADLSWASVCAPVLYAREYEYVEVNLTFSTTGWATLILPFDAELPEEVIAYSCYDTDGEVLELVENKSIKANIPYLMKGQEGDNYLFSGYSLADKDSYTDGLFTGTYVEYQTQADGKTYVFQSNNGETAFYLVSEDEPIVQPYNCYIVCENAESTPIFRLTHNGGTTNIDGSQLTNNNFELEIYDLMGRKVSSMEKGKMYIVNGVKVIVK